MQRWCRSHRDEWENKVRGVIAQVGRELDTWTPGLVPYRLEFGCGGGLESLNWVEPGCHVCVVPFGAVSGGHHGAAGDLCGVGAGPVV
jgi:hypothetical protein